MEITHLATSKNKEVVIELVEEADYGSLTEAEYHFDWLSEKGSDVYKLKFPDNDEILGLMSLKVYAAEKRIEIVLLASSVKNTGKGKEYEGIAGNLIAFACREANKLFDIDACVSLHPKTEIRRHYIKQYGFENAGIQIFLDGVALFNLLTKFKI
ncbi:N-acetyltransferase [Flavobacterium sp. DGU11]|uniref:N-acetyltransferase n=1 Tax=Flavobacterium arundinis TaxID=3139143 RepID=A0ABU9HSM6_9FLAO